MGFGARSFNPGDVLPPTVPVVTATRTGPQEITVTWGASSDASGVARYYIREYGVPSSEVEVIGPNRSKAYSGLTPNTAYRYEVRAQDIYGNISLYGASALVSTLPINVAPVWSVVPAWSLPYNTGGTRDVKPYVADANGDPITISLVNPPAGYTISNGVISATASVAAATLTLSASDGSLTATTTMSVTVASQTQPVNLQTFRDAGYKIVTDYPNVFPNSSTQDSRAGIQAAINECASLGYPLYFPSGTYYVSDTLFMVLWTRNRGTVGSWTGSPYHHTLVGDSVSRPVIKVMSSASAFNSTSITRPVVCCRTFYGYSLDAQSYPNPYIPSWLYTDPLSVTADWIDGYGVGFHLKFTNFVIDTSSKAGAIGLFWGTCQDSWVTNVKILATGSDIGIAGMGGCHGSVDIEVIGGRYGAYTGQIRQAYIASGQTGIAYKLYDQTVAALRVSDYTPVGLVGFHIRVGSGVTPVEINRVSGNTANGTPYLIDGIIECNGQVALTSPNTTMYARNVYVTGTDNILKTGSLPTVTGTGTWKRITEYATRNPDGAATGEYSTYPYRNLLHRAVVDGAFNTSQQIIAGVQSGTSAPPADLVSKHSPVSQIPWIDDGQPFVDVTDFGAVPYRPYASDSLAIDFGKGCYDSRYMVWDGVVDCLSAFNAAIAAAEAAGHNRVLVPRGVFYVSGTVNLRENTKLFGVGDRHSVIAVFRTWVPTTSPNYVVASASSTSGSAVMTNVYVFIPRIWGTLNSTTGQYSGDRFSKVLWRTGRRSMTWSLATDHQYYDETKPTQDRQNLTISGSGGGRHYFIEANGRGNSHPAFRGLLIKDTTEPTSIYANNFEISKGPSEWAASWNIEINNAQNVRVYDNKREGNGGTVLIHNSQNVGMWGPGVNLATIHNTPDFTRTKISGTSNNVVVALQTCQEAAYASDRLMLTESLSGRPLITMPNWEGLALYKRGELNDALMTHT